MLQSYVIVLSTTFISYLVFHIYDPHRPIILVALLLVVPAALSRHISPQSYDSASLTPKLIFTSYWSLLALFTIIYRLSPFHPLAKYPGPILHRISKLRTLQVSCRGHFHLHLQDLHHKYGDIVRFGPNDLSYANVDGVQPVLGSNGLPKGPYYDEGKPKPYIFGVCSPKDYAQIRLLWNKALSSTSLKSYEENIINRSRDLIEQLCKFTAEPVDISKWMDFFAFDVMGDIAFSTSFNLTKTGKDGQRYRQIITTGAQTRMCIAHVPWLGRLLRVFIPTDYVVRMLSNGLVRERLKAGSTAKDLFYYLSRDDGTEGNQNSHSMDEDQLIDNGVIAIVAGSDTTSTTMANLWYFLLKSPPHYCARLRKEVDAAFPFGEEPIDTQRLASMQYLNACINESMRLFPPGASGSQRTVLRTGSGGRMVGSHYIPEGTNINLHPYTLHRDERYFSPYPTTFWPDRWLEPADRESSVKQDEDVNAVVITDMAAFIPFSTGPRNCPGKNLAMMEMRIVVSYIVQRFDMKVADGYDLNEWEGNLRDYFILTKGALPVVLTPRVQFL